MKNINKTISIFVIILLGLATVVFSNGAKTKSVDYKIVFEKTVEAQTNITMNVNPGTLSQSIEHDLSTPTEVKLSSVDVSLAPPAGVDSTGELRTIVKDHRGVEIGWSQTLSCTDFDDDGVNIIPVTNLTVTPSSIAPIGGSDSTGIILGPSHTLLSDIDIMSIATAPPGFGTGRNRIINDMLLHVDKTTPVGSYKATVTLTVS